jgi:excisionase family DNA binding protein
VIACPYCGGETDFLLPQQVAQLMNVPVQTVRRWLRENRFPGAEQKNIRGRKVWAIPQKAVMPLLEVR